MNKYINIMLMLQFFTVSASFAAEEKQKEKQAVNASEETSIDQLLPVGEPVTPFCGVYIGLGIGMESSSRKITISDVNGNPSNNSGKNFNSSKPSTSFLAGFGRTLANNLYVSAELDFSFSNNDKKSASALTNAGTYSVEYRKRSLDYGMAGRLGYFIERSNALGFITLGGKDVGSTVKVVAPNGKSGEISYSVFRPFVGVGFEKKLSKKLSLRGDLSYAFGNTTKRSAAISQYDTRVNSKTSGTSFRVIGLYNVQ